MQKIRGPLDDQLKKDAEWIGRKAHWNSISLVGISRNGAKTLHNNAVPPLIKRPNKEICRYAEACTKTYSGKATKVTLDNILNVIFYCVNGKRIGQRL